ncbi:GNAT family N-acetyltransferase [Micromonospora rosaria]|uniref:GNAT family N-acetyltransferase n=1 Tax=Micromonospora rosaria TaxID=47874 RepID=UPI001471E6C9|nr:GNAT family N-acetyltransferase [Micromonospora rosaria]
MDGGVRLRVGGAGLAVARMDAICELYDAVFSEPPFFWRDDESSLHRARLSGLVEDPTFGVVVAEVGTEVVGFAYGFTLAVDTTRWSRLIEPVSSEVSREWPGRTFVLFDYAVERAHRGRGVGRGIHDALLASRREERATLTVQPTAVATKRIYEHWRWRWLGQLEGGAEGAAPLFDVYLRDSLGDLAVG